MWREAAQELGVEVEQLGPTLFEFRSGHASVRIRGQTTPFADPISCEVAADKPLAYRLMREAGLPVPEHDVVGVRDLAGALRFLEQLQGPCIVKPARGTGGGAGVTGEVRTRRQLRLAMVSAGRYDRDVVLEQQILGDSYRVLLLDGQPLDVLVRPRPTVVGDGRRTIEQLMFRQYAERIRAEGPSGLKPFAVDFDCLFTLEQGHQNIRATPPDGASVVIKTATNYNGPDQSRKVQPPYPEELVTLSRRAAEVVGVRLAGVDILAGGARDPVVLEVNPIPGLTHHYNVADQASATAIAVPILASLLRLESRPAGLPQAQARAR